MGPEDIAREIDGEESIDVGTSKLIVIHVWHDNEYINVTSTNNVTIPGDFASINLPNGSTVYFAKSLDAIKNNMDVNEELLDALFNAGLIEADDEGNFII